MSANRTTRLPNGEEVPALGLGTWHMGDRGGDPVAEADALRLGIDLGMTLIDTAEMYANGKSERVVAEAIKGRRDEVFLVSKILPHNASRKGTFEACDRSLQRMGVEVIDLYLLHWPGRYPLEDTIECFEELVAEGKIRYWGVSNFDTDEMAEVEAISPNCATNQILYNLSRRGPEFDLMPWCAARSMPMMAYSPLDQGRLNGHPTLMQIARKHEVSALQIALAWLLRQEGVISIPKAATQSHVRENAAALEIELDGNDLALLDGAFPPPKGKQHLEIL